MNYNTLSIGELTRLKKKVNAELKRLDEMKFGCMTKDAKLAIDQLITTEKDKLKLITSALKPKLEQSNDLT